MHKECQVSRTNGVWRLLGNGEPCPRLNVECERASVRSPGSWQLFSHCGDHWFGFRRLRAATCSSCSSAVWNQGLQFHPAPRGSATLVKSKHSLECRPSRATGEFSVNRRRNTNKSIEYEFEVFLWVSSLRKTGRPA